MNELFGVLGVIVFTLGVLGVITSLGSVWSFNDCSKTLALVSGILLGVGLGLCVYFIPRSIAEEERNKELTAICESQGGKEANHKCFINGMEVDVEKRDD